MIKINTFVDTFVDTPANFWFNLFFFEFNTMILKYDILSLDWEVGSSSTENIALEGKAFVESYIKDINMIHKQYFIRRNMKYWLPFWYSRVECASYLESIDQGSHAMYIQCMVMWVDTESIHTKVQLMNLKRL